MAYTGNEFKELKKPKVEPSAAVKTSLFIFFVFIRAIHPTASHQELAGTFDFLLMLSGEELMMLYSGLKSGLNRRDRRSFRKSVREVRFYLVSPNTDKLPLSRTITSFGHEKWG